jgi:hypothetical protein
VLNDDQTFALTVFAQKWKNTFGLNIRIELLLLVEEWEILPFRGCCRDALFFFPPGRTSLQEFGKMERF